MKKYYFSILFLIIISAFAYSSEKYYADLELQVEDNGVVHTKGTTNYAELSIKDTEYLTSKKGPYWLFNLTTKESFSDYFVSVEFPANTEINYLRVKGSFRLAQNGNLRIITFGNDEPIEIVAQYKLIVPNRKNYTLFFIVAFALIVFLFFIIRKLFPKKSVDSKKTDLIRKTLTQNQLLIFNILIQAKEPITQKQLLHRTQLPKSTLSRNLDIMEKKNILKKQSRGMVNVIFVNEELIK
ncbi:hypothetical protein JW930_07730 [Candidatus Woesearchaeota archaeon]|nr:hypothetical protein [Candidatus Woesearchaeota archaeon]